MSSIIVPIALVDAVLPHPDPETTSLELIQVLGWQLVAGKGYYTVGQKLAYVPPDSLVPLELSERLGVTKYLSKGRVRAIRLRGEPSFGLTIPPDEDWPVGENVAEHYGITKFEPPPLMHGDDGEPEHPLFQRYTKIENIRHFPDILQDGEPVVVCEKVDGTNCRIMLTDGQLVCGSHQLQRKQSSEKKASLYWYPVLHIAAIKELLEGLSKDARQVILFGEIYGPATKRSLHYEVPQGGIGFRVFDIYRDGRYLDWQETASLCSTYGIETVPVLAEGLPYSMETVKRLSAGMTTIGQGSHIREGVVVRPLHERTHPKTGRVILKCVSDEYLIRQSAGKVVDFSEV